MRTVPTISASTDDLADSITDPNVQGLLAFGLVYQTAGFLSAYETYRWRMVERLELQGQHSKPRDLLIAPFELQRLASPAVLVPLAAAAGLAYLGVQQSRREGARLFGDYRGRDAAFTMALSLNAGIGEEAFFRGFLMSYLHHRWQWNRWLANGMQATLFSLAHAPQDGKSFGIRLALGAYFGWLAQHRDYDLGDAVFVHAWWDIIMLSAAFALERSVGGENAAAYVTLPPIAF